MINKPSAGEVSSSAFQALSLYWKEAAIMALPMSVFVIVSSFVQPGLEDFTPNGEYSFGFKVVSMAMNLIAGYFGLHFQIAACRLLLLGEPMRLSQYLEFGNKRFWRLAGRWIGIIVVGGALYSAIASYMMSFDFDAGGGPLALTVALLIIALWVVSVVVVMGLNFITPLCALDMGWPMQESWRLTKGLRARIFGAHLLVGIAVIFPLVIILSLLLDPENPTGFPLVIVGALLQGLALLLTAISVRFYAYARDKDEGTIGTDMTNDSDTQEDETRAETHRSRTEDHKDHE